MPRELSDERCEMTFEDKISKAAITFYYKLPENTERIAFSREQRVCKRNRVIDKSAEAFLKYGLRIITGFKEGDFLVKGQPFSWDPQSPLYNPDWKAIIKKYAADLVSLLAFIVFVASANAKIPEPEDFPRGERKS